MTRVVLFSYLSIWYPRRDLVCTGQEHGSTDLLRTSYTAGAILGDGDTR